MLVSVIIPVFNSERFLLQCLQSVKACPSRDIECIIVNDGSTDDTAEICEEFIREDKRFYLIHKDNSGVSESRNIGLAKAVGEYVFFLDSDDYVSADRWLDILAHAKQGAYDMIAYGYYNLFTSGAIKEERFPDSCNIDLALLSTTLLNTCWGKLLRRDVIGKHGLGFQKGLKTCEDAVFVLDFTQKANNCMLSDIAVMYYRIHPGGAMQNTGLQHRISDFEVLYERRKGYLSENYSEANREAFDRQSFYVVTDLFRTAARNGSIPEIRDTLRECMTNPAITAIMDSAKTVRLSRGYKKLEYMMMRKRLFMFLAVYFKLKARVTEVGVN